MRLITTIPPDPVYCTSTVCPAGYAWVDGASDIECDGTTCEKNQCCEKVCTSFNCRGAFHPIDDAATTACNSSGCNRQQCCEKEGESYNSLFNYWKG